MEFDFVQWPLVLMECSVIADFYMGLGYNPAAFDIMLRLKKRALQFGGDFTFLWHNSHFLNPEDWDFFEGLMGKG